MGLLITNTEEHGGAFSPLLYDLLKHRETSRVRIVSGYVSKDIIQRTREVIQENRKIEFELVVGMAVKEGLTQGVYDALLGFNDDLQAKQKSDSSRGGIYGFFSGSEGQRDRGMHAKAYLFDQSNNKRLVVGSSNFSFSGLSQRGNVEMNLVTENPQDVSAFERFYENLHESHFAVPLHLIEDFPIKGAAAKRRKEQFGAILVNRPSDFKKYPFVDIDLGRNIDNQSKSNLNTFFGKGRWARSSGVVRPRDWYEVELIVPNEVTANPLYPKGTFQVVTSDGKAFEASTQGDYFKNLRSARDLKILGMWLKGLLEDAGALSQDPYEMVTAETFGKYGNSVMRMYRDSTSSAILHFPRNPADL